MEIMENKIIVFSNRGCWFYNIFFDRYWSLLEGKFFICVDLKSVLIDVINNLKDRVVVLINFGFI